MDFTELPSETQSALRLIIQRMNGHLHGECVAELEAIIAAHPTYVYAYTMLAECLEQVGRREYATELYRQAAQIDPDVPAVRCGLAWAAVREERWDVAQQHGERLTQDNQFLGQALAVLATVKEARGDTDGAAQDFLRAYRFDPMHTWLRKHCALSGRDFRVRGPNVKIDWELSVPERMWLFASVDNALSGVAQMLDHPGSSPPAEAGGRAVRFATAWAEARELDLVTFYEQLICRGGYSDSEILLNAAREDDRDYGCVLFAAELGPTSDEELASVWGEWLERVDAVPPPQPRDLDAGAPATQQGIVRDGGLHLPPQVGGTRFIGCILDWVIEQGKALRMTLHYPDGLAHGHDVIANDGRLSVESVPRNEASTLLDTTFDAPWKAFRDVTAIREPVLSEETLRLPALSEPLGGVLCGSSSRWSVVQADGSGSTGIDLAAEAIAFDPERQRIAWLEPFRNQYHLMVEDRRAGTRRRLRTDRFVPGKRLFSCLEFDRHGVLYASIDRGGPSVCTFDLESGKVRRLGPGTCVRAGGERLAIVAPNTNPNVSQPNVIHVLRAGKIEHTYFGDQPIWSPDGRTLVFCFKTADFGIQLFAAHDGSKAKRISPPCEAVAWPSVGREGLVFHMRSARRRTPGPEGRLMVRDDEHLMLWPWNGSAVKELYASKDGWMRIVAPLAHSEQPVVVFATQDGPQENQRLVLADLDGGIRDLARGGLSPQKWLVA
ncbi:MAG: hypothetical protein AAF654_08105 [Myxococcota bacterium]